MSFVFNGICSDTDLKFNITERNVYDAPVYDTQSYEVPGRSGDILIPQGRFKNKTISYTGFLKTSDFPGYKHTAWERLSRATQNLKALLLSQPGEYLPLKDSYDAGLTRYGCVTDIKIAPIHDRPTGVTVEIAFNVKPFMYDNEASYTITGGEPVTITNPFLFDSIPTIQLNIGAASGNTVLTINNETWEISDQQNKTVVGRGEEMEWTQGNTLINNKVGGPWHFPALKPGKNTVTLSSHANGTIEPNWRTL